MSRSAVTIVVFCLRQFCICEAVEMPMLVLGLFADRAYLLFPPLSIFHLRPSGAGAAFSFTDRFYLPQQLTIHERSHISAQRLLC
jgi:hypothetical protein